MHADDDDERIRITLNNEHWAGSHVHEGTPIIECSCSTLLIAG